MAVKLGTVAPVGFNDFASPEWMQCMKKLGCSTVQVYRNRHGNDDNHTGPVTVKQIKEYIKMAELPCDSIHGKYGNDLDPSSPDEPTRKQAVKTFITEGVLALELGGPIVIVHCSGIYPGGIGDKEKDLRRKSLLKSMQELNQFAKVEGVKYAFENLPAYHAIGSDVAELAELVREVDSDNIGMCFDTGHSHMSGDLEQLFSQAAKVMYIHACDNSGKKDEHLMPFLGTIEWETFAGSLAKKNYDGVMMLETFHTVQELERLINAGWPDKFRELLSIANAMG